MSDVMPLVNYDDEMEVINGPLTFHAVAQHLSHGSAILGWTDGHGTHFDVMFTLAPFPAGSMMGGIKMFGYLYVSIMRVGAFAFRIDLPDTEAGYYGEKLHIEGGNDNETLVALAELINGIKKELLS